MQYLSYGEEVGRRILITIRENGYTENMYAKVNKVSRSNVYEWCRGEHLPSAYRITQFCRFFNVSADWLLGV